MRSRLTSVLAVSCAVWRVGMGWCSRCKRFAPSHNQWHPIRRSAPKTASYIPLHCCCCVLPQGLGMEVLAYDVRQNPAVEAMDIPYHDMDYILERADVISLHVPLLPSTHHFINKDRSDTLTQQAQQLPVAASEQALRDCCSCLQTVLHHQSQRSEQPAASGCLCPCALTVCWIVSPVSSV